MTMQIGVAVLVGIAAIVEDVARRQISNWIPALALVGGLAALTMERGWSGVASSLLGAVGGFVVFLVFYLLGGMGGGDVKLMAGFGAVLGYEHLLEAALWTAGVGGMIALATVGITTLRNRWRKSGEPAAAAIPYAPAIAIGAWLALVPKV